jgi:hypothetical protein
MLTDFSKNIENWPSGATVSCEQTGMMKLAAFCTCSVNMPMKSTLWEQLFVPLHERLGGFYPHVSDKKQYFQSLDNLAGF